MTQLLEFLLHPSLLNCSLEESHRLSECQPVRSAIRWNKPSLRDVDVYQGHYARGFVSGHLGDCDIFHGLPGVRDCDVSHRCWKIWNESIYSKCWGHFKNVWKIWAETSLAHVLRTGAATSLVCVGCLGVY